MKIGNEKKESPKRQTAIDRSEMLMNAMDDGEVVVSDQEFVIEPESELIEIPDMVDSIDVQPGD
jgi:hypothetical protein